MSGYCYIYSTGSSLLWRREGCTNAGYQAHLADRTTSPPSVDAVLVDVTSLLAAPLAGLRAQRRMNCQAPALLVAARMTESIAADMLPLGVRGFVMKPADDAGLLAALNELLAKKNPRGRASTPSLMSL